MLFCFRSNFGAPSNNVGQFGGGCQNRLNNFGGGNHAFGYQAENFANRNISRQGFPSKIEGGLDDWYERSEQRLAIQERIAELRKQQAGIDVYNENVRQANYINTLQARSARPRFVPTNYQQRPQMQEYTSASTGRFSRASMKYSIEQRAERISQIDQIIARDYNKFTPQQQQILTNAYTRMMSQYRADLEAYNAHTEYVAHVPRMTPGITENAGFGRIQANLDLQRGLVTFTGFHSQRAQMDFYNQLGIPPGQTHIPLTHDLYNRLLQLQGNSSYESRERYASRRSQRRSTVADNRLDRLNALQTVRNYHRNRGVARYEPPSRASVQDSYAAYRSPSTYNSYNSGQYHYDRSSHKNRYTG